MISDSSSTSMSKYSVSPAATVPPGLFMEMLLTTGGVRSSEAAKTGVDSMPITKHRERKIANSRLFMLYFLRPFSSVVFSEKILPEILPFRKAFPTLLFFNGGIEKCRFLCYPVHCKKQSRFYKKVNIPVRMLLLQ